MNTPGTFQLSGTVELLAGQDNAQASVKRFRGVAYSGGVVPNYGWSNAMAIDLASLESRPSVVALFNHETSKPIGVARVDNTGTALNVEGEIDLQSEHGAQIGRLLDMGAPIQFSVGINAVAETKRLDKPTSVNGRELTVDTLLTQARLLEVSFVAAGADPNTSVSTFAAQAQSNQPAAHTPQGETSMTEIDELKAAHAAELAAIKAEKESALVALEAAELEIQTHRKAALLAAHEAAGVKMEDAQVTALLAADAAVFTAHLSALSAVKPAKAEPAPGMTEHKAAGGAEQDAADAFLAAYGITA